MLFDAADKKVLSALFADARKPLSAVARENGLSREVVEYRIGKLANAGVITGFIAQINQVLFCAGVAQLRVKLVRTDPLRFEDIVEAVRRHPSVNWAAELCGDADLVMTVFFTDSEDLAKTIGELVLAMGDLVREQDVALYITEHKYDMLGLVKEHELSRVTPVTFRGKMQVALDEKDMVLLRELAPNCRITTVALAQRVGLSEDAVRQRIRALERNNVILGYTILLGAAECGYEQYYVRFLVEQFTADVSSKLSYYVRTSRFITYCCETVGNYNIVMTIAAQSHRHFLEILLDIRKHFGTLLTDYEFQIVVRELKGVYVPTKLLQDRASGF